MTVSITMLCHYAECHVLFIIMLNVSMLSVIWLCVVAPILNYCSAILMEQILTKASNILLRDTHLQNSFRPIFGKFFVT
jgi:hypothetical protein